jgi:hypothetical protein
MKKITVVLIQQDDIWLVDDSEENKPKVLARTSGHKQLFKALSEATGVKIEQAEYPRDYLYSTLAKATK